MDNKCCIIRKTSYILNSEYQEVAIGKLRGQKQSWGWEVEAEAEAEGKQAEFKMSVRGVRRGHDCMVEELDRRRRRQTNLIYKSSGCRGSHAIWN